ncbi:MAG: SGNH/GDSL hydrolase family protein [Pseudomonadota bacterium]
MKKWIAAISAILVCTAAAPAEPQDVCAVPGYLLYGDAPLERVAASANKEKKLKVVVIGTASAMLPGPDGANAAFPARLEAALKKRLPKVDISLITQTKPRQTAAEMSDSIEKLIVDDKPNLVVWQTGTYDALKGADPEEFRSSISDGVEALHTGGADVILMNMQYSPRTESMISLGAYLDNMRWVAREREVPLFDRNAIMRHWNDVGAIDLYRATKDVDIAKRVHDCIGRALAALVIDGAHLEALEAKPAQ